MTEPMGFLAAFDSAFTNNHGLGRLIPVTLKLWLSLVPSRVHRKPLGLSTHPTSKTIISQQQQQPPPILLFDKASLTAATLLFS